MLTYSVELDEGVFTVGTPRKKEKMKQGSKERKATVLVMAESIEVEKPMPNMKKKKVGHLKMLVIPDTKKLSNTALRAAPLPKSQRNRFNRTIPNAKRRSQYPAILIGQLN